MLALPRRNLLNRSLTSSLHNVCNGKGRPQLVLEKISSRSISTTPRSHSRLYKRPSLRQSAVTLPATSRFLSTGSSGDTLLAKPSPAVADSSSYVTDPTGANAWDPNFGDIVSPIADIEPHIGYLKELGLNFGWGPTSILQSIVEYVDVYAGLPWYGTLLASIGVLRLLCIPLFISAADTSGRMVSIQHVTKPFRDRAMAARAQGDTATTIANYKEALAIERRAGIKKIRSFYPIFIQLPLGIAAFRLTRAMAALPVPGLDTGGALWFHDLTVSDPYYILPAMTSVFIYLGMRRGGETGVATAEQVKVLAYLKYIFPAISFAFTSYLPAALTLQFCATSLFSLGQTYVFSSNRTRAMLGIHPIIRRNDDDTTTRSTVNKLIMDATKNELPKSFGTKIMDKIKGEGGTTADGEKEPGAWESAKKQAEQWMGRRESGKNARLTKVSKNKADAYEKRRREELEEDMYHRRQQLEKQRQREREQQ